MKILLLETSAEVDVRPKISGLGKNAKERSVSLLIPWQEIDKVFPGSPGGKVFPDLPK